MWIKKKKTRPYLLVKDFVQMGIIPSHKLRTFTRSKNFKQIKTKRNSKAQGGKIRVLSSVEEVKSIYSNWVKEVLEKQQNSYAV